MRTSISLTSICRSWPTMMTAASKAWWRRIASFLRPSSAAMNGHRIMSKLSSPPQRSTTLACRTNFLASRLCNATNRRNRLPTGSTTPRKLAISYGACLPKKTSRKRWCQSLANQISHSSPINSPLLSSDSKLISFQACSRIRLIARKKLCP